MKNLMFADIFIYFVLGWYFESIWPSEFGTHKPWYFIFLPSYWQSVIVQLVGTLSCGQFNTRLYIYILDIIN